MRYNSAAIMKGPAGLLGFCLIIASVECRPAPESPPLSLEVEQITKGPQNHFFGYIGHVQNIPWNGSGRYLIALRVGFHDRMPTPDDPADIVLLDTTNGYAVRRVEQTRAWNPQQGTMFYWNPDAPETQFFFNDRDPETNRVFCVLYDIEQARRIREYAFEDTPIGNGGVNQKGGSFAGINYGRLARLRPVTGYPNAYDWTDGTLHPENDGVFLVDVTRGRKRLLVSFRQMRDALVEGHPRVDRTALFINHTLWNRDGDRLYFFVRGNFGDRATRVNIPMTVRSDGSELTEQTVFIGGHPEWESGAQMIGTVDNRLVIYDSSQQRVMEELGTPTVFPDPGNDVALSPDGDWVVQGIEDGSRNAYAVYRRSDGAWAHTGWFDQGDYDSGPLRIDAGPKWNRSSDHILFSSLTNDPEPTRQLFLIRVMSDR
ncbi:hypothetical protein MYX75_09555 [Acidobacteria bacterium AH-259-A15]|nr:hypothetical protein [Acidobacteria bacterium AH-259-A15]